MIASNKHRQEPHKIATLHNEKIEGSAWALQQPLACPRTQMQTLISMDSGVSQESITTWQQWMNAQSIKPILSNKIKNL